MLPTVANCSNENVSTNLWHFVTTPQTSTNSKLNLLPGRCIITSSMYLTSELLEAKSLAAFGVILVGSEGLWQMCFSSAEHFTLDSRYSSTMSRSSQCIWKDWICNQSRGVSYPKSEPYSSMFYHLFSIISSCVLHSKSNSPGAPCYSNRNQLGRLSFQALPDHLASGIRWASTQIMLSSCRCERIRQKLAFNEQDWVGTSRGWLVQYCPGSNLLNLALSEHGVPWKCHRRYFIAGKQMFSILNHWTWILCFQTEHLLPQKTESYGASDAAVPSWHSSCSKITPGIQAGPNNRCPTPSERSTHEHHWIYIVYLYIYINMPTCCSCANDTCQLCINHHHISYKGQGYGIITNRSADCWWPSVLLPNGNQPHQGRRIPAIICHPILRQPFE